MTTTFRRDAYTWLTYLLLAYFAFFLNALGPAAPFLKEELNLSYTTSGLHFTAFAAGMLLVGAAGSPLIRRLGRRRALWLGAFGLAASTLLFLLGRHPTLTITAALLMGVLGSLIVTIVPAALSAHHGPLSGTAISEANVMASLASAGAPLLIGTFAPLPGGWRLGLALVALLPLLLYPRMGSARSAAGSAANLPEPLAPAAPLPARYWALWFALLLAVAVEFCLIAWGADFLENVHGLPRATAARTVSLFLGGMVLGRLATGALVRRRPAQQVVIGAILLAAAGYLLFWLAPSAAGSQLGLAVAGLGVAGLYPLILTIGIAAAGAQTTLASARAVLASGLAILLLPLLLGRLADSVGIADAYAVVGLLLAALLLLMAAQSRFS